MAAKQHVTVVLNGDGGDENFAGYTQRHRAYSLAKSLRLSPCVRRGVFDLQRMIPEGVSEAGSLFRIRKTLRVLGSEQWRRNVALIEAFPPSAVKALLANQMDYRDDIYSPIEAVWKNASKYTGLNRELYLGLVLELPEQLLVKVDRASMAWALEVRSPFLDRNFVDFCARIPSTLKLHGQQSKFVLKEALRGIVPTDVLTRRKQGFTPPFGQWLRRELRELVQENLLSSDSFVKNYLHSSSVERLVKEHLDGHKDHRKRLYNLLVLELWERQFIRQQSFGTATSSAKMGRYCQ